MNKVRIKVIKITYYEDLAIKYENHLEMPCMMKLNDEFIVSENIKPKGLCQTAWETLSPFVDSLLKGEGNFYDGWMKNPLSAIVSCNDGVRPVSFLVEVLE